MSYQNSGLKNEDKDASVINAFKHTELPRMISPARPQIDLVLIGGGHAHVSVLRSFGMNPVSGLRITVISDVLDAPYSGMLPGYVEGVWSYEDMHINLPQLCQFAHARLIHGSVSAVDVQAKRIEIEHAAPIEYDLLSINSGAQPDLEAIDGADRYGIAVKPISHFIKKIPQNINNDTKLSIIGGGAAGVELALAFRTRYQHKGIMPHIAIINRQNRLMPSAPHAVSNWLEEICQTRNIQTYHNSEVEKVTADSILTTDQKIASDHHFLVTAVKPAHWIKKIEAQHDESGFLLTRPTLQLLEFDTIFAAGDVAQIVQNERPKAGVFAVRAGPVLAKNIRLLLDEKQLYSYTPQRRYLALIGLANNHAIAIRGRWSAKAGFLWALKCWIEKRFMDRFNKLPQMTVNKLNYPHYITRIQPQSASNIIYCAGCGSKAGSEILYQAISEARQIALDKGANPAYLPEPENLSDSAAITLPKNTTLLQSIDTLSQHISDPFTFGRIAALHAMSDIFVSGGQMLTAMAHISVQRSSLTLQRRDLSTMLAGAMIETSAHHCALSGGHSVAGEDASFGLSVTGILSKQAEKQLSSVPQCGKKYHLILTKPLGVGIILAAQMKGGAPAAAIFAAHASMLESNALPAEILRSNGAIGMTDITGFGLAGHGQSLLSQKQFSGAHLYLDNIPVLEGALALSQRGISSSIFPQNKAAISYQIDHKHITDSTYLDVVDLLFDPQTSGGILALVPENRVKACLASLHHEGAVSAASIGTASDTVSGWIFCQRTF